MDWILHAGQFVFLLALLLSSAIIGTGASLCLFPTLWMGQGLGLELLSIDLPWPSQHDPQPAWQC